MSEDLMQRLDNLWAMLEEEGYYTKADTVTLAKDYISSLEWFREQVVWGFYEDGKPTYHQGKAGEHELCSPVTAEEVTGLLDKLKETEARLSKAILIIERYEEDEGYIPRSVAHLYEELEAAAEQRGYANAMEAERKLTDQICAEWAETSQRNYQCAKKYFEALETIAQTQYGLQSIMEDYPDTDSPEYLAAALEYYTRLVNLYQKIAREAIKDVEN